MKKNPHRTSFRSVTHTTDSTRSGWTAKSSAAEARPDRQAGLGGSRAGSAQAAGGR